MRTKRSHAKGRTIINKRRRRNYIRDIWRTNRETTL